jgi:hypothetical protein
MIESINPTTLMDFATAVANWAVMRPDSLDDELEQIRSSIDTFCRNNDDPIYQGVNILCSAAIDVMIQIMTHQEEAEIPSEPQEEITEVKENGGEPSHDNNVD